MGVYFWLTPFPASNIAVFTVAAMRWACGLPSVPATIAWSISSFHTRVWSALPAWPNSGRATGGESNHAAPSVSEATKRLLVAEPQPDEEKNLKVFVTAMKKSSISSSAPETPHGVSAGAHAEDRGRLLDADVKICWRKPELLPTN